MTHDEPLHDLQRRLERRLVSRATASALAVELGRFADDPAAAALRARFAEALREAGFEDLAATQHAYAVRIATAPGALEYEELHKLGGLVAELRALDRLGFPLDDAARAALEAALRHRAAHQPGAMQLVDEDRSRG